MYYFSTSEDMVRSLKHTVILNHDYTLSCQQPFDLKDPFESSFYSYHLFQETAWDIRPLTKNFLPYDIQTDLFIPGEGPHFAGLVLWGKGVDSEGGSGAPRTGNAAHLSAFLNTWNSTASRPGTVSFVSMFVFIIAPSSIPLSLPSLRTYQNIPYKF